MLIITLMQWMQLWLVTYSIFIQMEHKRINEKRNENKLLKKIYNYNKLLHKQLFCIAAVIARFLLGFTLIIIISC